MKKNYITIVLLLFIFQSYTSYAQLTITFPRDRIVLQRNNSNQAILTVAGYVSDCRDRVEARLVPTQSSPSGPVLGSPVPADGGWINLSSGTLCENFSGQIVVPGGWYQLQVRSIKNGSVTDESSVEHVGVGEVFLVAGQSNATGGDSNISGPGASEDAVSSVNFQNVPIRPYPELQLPCTEYVHLDQETKTAPFGNYAWCWGSFGDKLVQKLGVPVMIFNAGWSSTGVWNWKESIDFNSTTPTISAFGYSFPTGLPFGHLRKALNNYIAESGIRAILWHQGESDNIVERTRQAYYDDLRDVINASRGLSGKPNLAWLISRASRFTVNGESRVWSPVIDAQNDVIGLPDNITKLPHAFPGPETDHFYTSEYRSDEIHFAGDGLLFLAQLWADRIDNDFLLNSEPYPALSLPDVTVARSGTGTITLTGANGWSGYSWASPGECNSYLSSGQQFSTSPGLYQLRVVDDHDNTLFSPLIFTKDRSLPVTLTSFKVAEMTHPAAVTIAWTTSSETNASHFEVLKSTNGKLFSVIASIDAKGFSNKPVEYRIVDTDVTAGDYFYRLKQVDNDGKFVLTQIDHIVLKDHNMVTVFPNPAENILNISSENPIFTLDVFNTSGLKLKSFAPGSKTETIDISGYLPGVYSIDVNGRKYKIVKSR